MNYERMIKMERGTTTVLWVGLGKIGWAVGELARGEDTIVPLHQSV